MKVRVRCANCGKQYGIDQRWLGKRTRCKACGQVMTLTALAADPPAAVPSTDEPDWGALEAMAAMQPPAAIAPVPPPTIPQPVAVPPPIAAPTGQASAPSRRSASPDGLALWAGITMMAVGVVLLGGVVVAVYTFLNREPVIWPFHRLVGGKFEFDDESYSPFTAVIVTLLSMAVGWASTVIGRQYLAVSASDLPRRILQFSAIGLAAVWAAYFVYFLFDQGLTHVVPAAPRWNLPERRYFNWTALTFPIPLLGALAATWLLGASQWTSRPTASRLRAAPVMAAVALVVSLALSVYAYQSPLGRMRRALLTLRDVPMEQYLTNPIPRAMPPNLPPVEPRPSPRMRSAAPPAPTPQRRAQ